MISPDQAALDPARAAASAALALADFLILVIVCGQFRPDIGSRSSLPMPSVDPVISAMIEVNKELQVHFHHLASPGLDASDRKAIGTNAAEGVRRGLTLVALHQQLLNLQLDELEALALQS